MWYSGLVALRHVRSSHAEIEPVSPAAVSADSEGVIFLNQFTHICFSLGAHCLSSGFSTPHAGGPPGVPPVDLPLVCNGHMAQILTPELLPPEAGSKFHEAVKAHPLRLGPRLPAASPHARFMQLRKLSSFPTFASCCIRPLQPDIPARAQLISCRRTWFSGAQLLLLKEVQDSILE